jgi:hypothetical protein
MRLRIWAAIGLTMLAVALAGCSADRAARGPAGTPVPTKTLRPTFTSTPAKPTLAPTITPEPPTPTPVVIASEAPTATPEPPTPTLSPEPEVARLTADAAVNVRNGPGTAYGQIGQLKAGQAFAITGKNPAGDWWQFDFNGRSGWVLGRLVRVSGAELVQVAQNIPAVPTARPRPSAAPAAPRPTSPPAPPQAPTFQFAAVQAAPFPNTNNYLTVRCRTTADIASGSGPAGILLVTGPASAPPQAFSTSLNRANTGMEQSMQYMYNENCKVEIAPFVPGTYTGILVDGGGKQISEPLTFTPDGNTREFMLVWRPR